MGMNFFSITCDISNTWSAPNPLRYKIISSEQIGYFVIAKIFYPDCTNFEGLKICVYEDLTESELRSKTELDPHFSVDYDSPVARFKPTEHGIRLAHKFVEYMNSEIE